MIFQLKSVFKAYYLTSKPFLNPGLRTLYQGRRGMAIIKYFYLGVPLRVGLFVAINVVRFALNIDLHSNP